MRIIIENADQRDFNELAILARQGKIHTFYMTDEDERPQGEWVKKHVTFGTCTLQGYECNCGRVVMQRENFCPECGADMRGGAE